MDSVVHHSPIAHAQVKDFFVRYVQWYISKLDSGDVLQLLLDLDLVLFVDDGGGGGGDVGADIHIWFQLEVASIIPACRVIKTKAVMRIDFQDIKYYVSKVIKGEVFRWGCRIGFDFVDVDFKDISVGLLLLNNLSECSHVGVSCRQTSSSPWWSPRCQG